MSKREEVMEEAGQENAGVFFAPQMNGASVMEGVDGGRTVRSQLRFRNMEYGKGQPLWRCQAGSWKC